MTTTVILGPPDALHKGIHGALVPTAVDTTCEARRGRRVPGRWEPMVFRSARR
jgi:hypothetical protein